MLYNPHAIWKNHLNDMQNCAVKRLFLETHPPIALDADTSILLLHQLCSCRISVTLHVAAMNHIS